MAAEVLGELEKTYHTPVLLAEVVEGLVTAPEGLYVDATFGGGGHSRAILARLGPKGRLIGLDCDPEAPLDSLQDPRFMPLRGNFRQLGALLAEYGIQDVTGILADLGVSSHQLDTPQRGFSYRWAAPLDLRMNPKEGQPAWAWLLRESVETIAECLRKYGEVPHSRRLARRLKAALYPYFSTQDLRACVEAVYGPAAHRHLAPVFQALRIALNDELNALAEFLAQTTTLLRRGGRLVLLTYHSGEVRLVKAHQRQLEWADPITGARTYAWRLLAKFRPSPQEKAANPRSRSATLWILERV
ncbi:MAG: 16S rRNA (cytosine(1402)-N(4))-methyltransferase RsmH [Bacteroidia bacterium]|nr:16S rRNA (cytosine(1402)-N(4))-methyltransferase RsmH [Bacteroidia bacterium]MDW8088957.1 16S rRNA (cytosine(1402)-N(4))-methyltransferase RsmH [Bacteroidia bacterium]